MSNSPAEGNLEALSFIEPTIHAVGSYAGRVLSDTPKTEVRALEKVEASQTIDQVAGCQWVASLQKAPLCQCLLVPT